MVEKNGQVGTLTTQEPAGEFNPPPSLDTPEASLTETDTSDKSPVRLTGLGGFFDNLTGGFKGLFDNKILRGVIIFVIAFLVLKFAVFR